MTKTMKIEGMMCGHCTGRVEQALNALEGVKAEVSLDNKTATVTAVEEIAEELQQIIIMQERSDEKFQSTLIEMQKDIRKIKTQSKEHEYRISKLEDTQEELEETVYKMALEKIANSKNYLPVVHKEKQFEIFGDTKAQIEFLRLENRNIENQIILERGSKFETEFK